MHVRFHGVRGSVPWTAPDAVGYGCNTACIEIVDERTAARLVLDAGSGIVGVLPPPHTRVSVLFTHYHWDHVLGLPYLASLFDSSCELSLHAPVLPSYDPSWLPALFRAPYHPLPYESLATHPQPRPVEPGRVAIDGFAVTALPLNHPGGAMAYRIAGASGDFVYATDHEFGDPAYDEPLAAFVRGAAALVIDAHFTPEELPLHAGWGHGDWRQCAELAAAHDVTALYLFHHKPGRTDRELDAIELAARGIHRETYAAREGHTFPI
jgi:phosphoribosyl 1,2-cyclic phosphodiesterase